MRGETVNITIGTPCTYSVGSDSYACLITNVEFFKSGKRKGEIKAVEAAFAERDASGRLSIKPGRTSHRFLPRVVGPCPRHGTENASFCGNCAVAGTTVLDGITENRRVPWKSLRIGKAVDYRDPSF